MRGRCGTMWDGVGCTADALELPPPCAEPPMYSDVIEGCTSIGPTSVLLSRRWPDVGAKHPRCQKCYQYSILSHCSLVCNVYDITYVNIMKTLRHPPSSLPNTSISKHHGGLSPHWAGHRFCCPLIGLDIGTVVPTLGQWLAKPYLVPKTLLI